MTQQSASSDPPVRSRHRQERGAAGERCIAAQDLTGVEQTLLFTLRARADEHRRADRLFDDPLAARWAERLPWPDALADLYDWRFQASIAIRARTFDEVAERFLRRRPVRRRLIRRESIRAPLTPLVVELGAGLSTRYERVGRGGARWIELDLPDVIALRRRLETESAEHTFLARSLTDPAWMDELPDVAPEDVLFIAEGVLGFVEPADVRALVRRLSDRFAGATLLLDVAGEELRESLGDRFAAVGAPVRWLVRDEGDVAALGARPIQVWPILRQYPERWGEIASLPWTPTLRNSGLLIKALIE